MKPRTRLVTLASMATLVSVGVLLACAGDKAKPTAGAWTGSDVSINVAEDGTKLTRAGSTLDEGASLIVRIRLEPNEFGMSAQTQFLYDDIPIRDGAFSYRKGGLEVSGTWQSPTEVSGSYRLVDEVQQPTAWGMTTGTIRGSGEWSTTQVEGGN